MEALSDRFFRLLNLLKLLLLELGLGQSILSHSKDCLLIVQTLVFFSIAFVFVRSYLAHVRLILRFWTIPDRYVRHRTRHVRYLGFRPPF